MPGSRKKTNDHYNWAKKVYITRMCWACAFVIYIVTRILPNLNIIYKIALSIIYFWSLLLFPYVHVCIYVHVIDCLLVETIIFYVFCNSMWYIFSTIFFICFCTFFFIKIRNISILFSLLFFCYIFIYFFPDDVATNYISIIKIVI